MGTTDRNWNRREFLTASAAAALATGLAQKADAAPADASGEWRNKQQGMAYRRLGKTNFMVSEIVMGGVNINPDNWEHVLPAMDRGLNYLDTASNYGRGNSERAFAKVIQSRPRDSFFLCTKVNAWASNRRNLYRDIFDSLPASEQKKLERRARDRIAERKADDPDYICNYLSSQPRNLMAATLADVMSKKYGGQIDRDKNFRRIIFDEIEQSLERLGTDYVDVLTVPHGADTGFEAAGHPEIFEAFEKLKKAGKVGHLSVSAHTDPGGVLEAAAKTGVYSMAMIAYNIVNSRYMERSLKVAQELDCGVIAMKVARPVHNGRGRGVIDPPERVKLIEDAVPGPLKVPQK
ncbi:MAG: aldo/keto reductase, partial [bacterium]|nr:aldo/keto reductase [bacterium]